MYIYRFKDCKENIIYVGKAKDYISRLKHHEHLPKECYDKVFNIEYADCKNEVDYSIYEIYYINKYKPEYNTEYKSKKDNSILSLPEVKWEKVKGVKLINFKGLESESKSKDSYKKYTSFKLDIEGSNKKVSVSEFDKKYIATIYSNDRMEYKEFMEILNNSFKNVKNLRKVNYHSKENGGYFANMITILK